MQASLQCSNFLCYSLKQLHLLEPNCRYPSQHRTRSPTRLRTRPHAKMTRVSFAQLFGGVLEIGICGTVFANMQSRGLKEFAPDAPFDLVRHHVAVIWALPPEMRKGIIHALVLVSPTQPISNTGK
jgi:hypothetical protein